MDFSTLGPWLESMGGWNAVLMALATSTVATMFQTMIKSMVKGESIHRLVKLGTALLAAWLLAIIWSDASTEIGQRTVINFVLGTFVWNNALKPALKKFGKNESE